MITLLVILGLTSGSYIKDEWYEDSNSNLPDIFRTEDRRLMIERTYKPISMKLWSKSISSPQVIKH